MSNTRWIKQHTVKVKSGIVREFSTRGGMVHCYYASNENIEISIDGEAWAPFTRGIKIPLSFDRLFFRHSTGSNETLTIVVASDPDAYQDNRELAAQVALNGVDIQVINSSKTSEGGSVHDLGTSTGNIYVGDPAAQVTELISAAANVNGITLHLLLCDVTTYVGGSDTYLRANNPLTYLDWYKSADVKTLRDEYYLPPGASLDFRTGPGTYAHIMYNYTIW